MAKPILKRLTEQLRAKGMPEGKAVAVAIKKMRAAGNIEKKSTKMTKRGMVRSKMGAAGRAKDRAAKEQGKPASSFTYNHITNRARAK